MYYIDAVREAVKSKSATFYALTKKPEFDALLMAVMEYFRRFLKNYHSKNESSWLVQKFKR